MHKDIHQTDAHVPGDNMAGEKLQAPVPLHTGGDVPLRVLALRAGAAALQADTFLAGARCPVAAASEAPGRLARARERAPETPLLLDAEVVPWAPYRRLYIQVIRKGCDSVCAPDMSCVPELPYDLLTRERFPRHYGAPGS